VWAGIFFLGTAVFAEIPLPTEPSALNYTQNHSLGEIDPNLTGDGTVIGAVCRSQTYINEQPQNDYRFNMNHKSLYDADIVFMDGTNGTYGISGHETSLAGVLLGIDDNATYPGLGTFRYRGVCPDASVNAYEFTDFATQKLLPNRSFQEDIILLSLGEMFEFWWVRALEQSAARDDFLIVASNGNGQNSNTPTPLYPGAGSNVLSVGIVDTATGPDENISFQSFSTPKPMNSSIGPTEDQRCKPDMVAPGTALVPSGDNADDYVLHTNWSSLSAPIVAGTAALLHQKGTGDPMLKESFDRAGKSLVLKSVLLNSSRKLPYWHKGQIDSEDDHQRPLDYLQGAGVLDTLGAYEQLTAGPGKPGQVQNTGWDNNILQSSDEGYKYIFDVDESNQMISATLCWNRLYQDQYPFNHLLEKDTDLRLELWGLNADDNQVLLDYSDSINDNVEHIYFATNHSYRSYAIRVRFNPDQEVEASASQRFALAWSVGPDRQIGDRWWYDLNADNKINANDKVIYTLIESKLINRSEMIPLIQSLGLSDERLQLLARGWPAWKPYLTDWNE
jgi:hypothetical protein